MTDSINNGGPAFPTRDYDPGMTLRDYFAGQALANSYSQDANNDKLVAKWAYQVADAMLEARK